MRCLTLISTVLLLHYSAASFDYDTRGWFKGNTHTHSLWSDGNDFPEMIFDWYKQRDYHFVAMSDHNVLQEGEKWMTVAAIRKRQRALGRDAVSKCLARFGKEWIVRETRDGEESIRLKTLDECRALLEESGQFLLLPAEEVSNAARKKPIHINALNLTEVVPAIKDEEASSEDVIRRSLTLIQEHEDKSGNPVLAHLNHPNFQWAINGQDLAAVAKGRFVEIYNGHPGINHLGDTNRPGDQKNWDIANTIRLAEMGAAPLFGVATDDSHTYHGGDVSPGRGWVHVGADSLNCDDLVTAMREGKFYASSGVALQRIQFDSETRVLSLEIEAEPGVAYETQFIGTRTSYDATAEDTGIGEVFATVTGKTASLEIPANALYLRATVTSSKNHPNRSYPNQKEQAWTQPVGWRK
ncbi:MAG: hypothetical protein AAGF67_04680 [Verrucomicrobiota bacterium]